MQASWPLKTTVLPGKNKDTQNGYCMATCEVTHALGVGYRTRTPASIVSETMQPNRDVGPTGPFQVGTFSQGPISFCCLPNTSPHCLQLPATVGLSISGLLDPIPLQCTQSLHTAGPEPVGGVWPGGDHSHQCCRLSHSVSLVGHSRDRCAGQSWHSPRCCGHLEIEPTDLLFKYTCIYCFGCL